MAKDDMWECFRERMEKGDFLALSLAQWPLLQELLAMPTAEAITRHLVSCGLDQDTFRALNGTIALALGSVLEQAGLKSGQDWEDVSRYLSSGLKPGNEWDEISRYLPLGNLRNSAPAFKADHQIALRLANLFLIQKIVTSGLHLNDPAPGLSPPEPVLPLPSKGQEYFNTLTAVASRQSFWSGRATRGLANDQVLTGLKQVLDEYRSLSKDLPDGSVFKTFADRAVPSVMESIARAQSVLGRGKEAAEQYKEAGLAWEALGEAGQAGRCFDEFRNIVVASPNANDALDLLLGRLMEFEPEEHSLERAGILIDLAHLYGMGGDLFEANNRLKEGVDELKFLGYPQAPDQDFSGVFLKWCEAIPDRPNSSANDFLASLFKVVTLYATVASTRAIIHKNTDPGEANLASQQLEQLSVLTLEINKEATAVQASLTKRMAALGLSPSAGHFADLPLRAETQDTTLAETENRIERWNQRLIDLRMESERRGSNGDSQHDLLRTALDLESEARELNLPLNVAWAMTQRSDILMACGRTAEAIDALKSARTLLQPFKGSTERAFTLTIFAKIAAAYMSGPDWVNISTTCEDAITESEQVRSEISAPYLQAAYLRDRDDVYTWGVGSAFMLKDYAKMLERAELSKARSTIPGGSASEVPDHSKDKLRREFEEVCGLINKAGIDREQLEQLLAKRRALSDLLMIQRSGPPPKINQFTLQAFQSALDHDVAVVYYYWLAPTVFVIAVIDNRDILVERRDLTQDERNLLNRLIESINSLEGSAFWLDKRVRDLSPRLLPDAARRLMESKKRLVFSPHRLLHQFPFHAAVLEREFLISQYAVSYAPNLSSLLIPHKQSADKRVLAITIQDFSVTGRRGEQLGELAQTERELTAIQRIYRERAVPVQVLRDKKATRSQLQQWNKDGTLARFTCLHFATHGKSVLSDTPMESYLYLSDSRLDGLEIAEWNLNADLVVLSACYSGERAIGARGMEELPGDDLLGLQRAFFIAGAKAVLGSLWPADSDAAVEVMRAFHRSLAKGLFPDVALQTAIVSYLKKASEIERPIYYWAPFFISSVSLTRAKATVE
jgi:CHAT domain-containing protein/tetratricopeptide (TPR) repeat protein